LSEYKSDHPNADIHSYCKLVHSKVNNIKDLRIDQQRRLFEGMSRKCERFDKVGWELLKKDFAVVHQSGQGGHSLLFGGRV